MRFQRRYCRCCPALALPPVKPRGEGNGSLRCNGSLNPVPDYLGSRIRMQPRAGPVERMRRLARKSTRSGPCRLAVSGAEEPGRSPHPGLPSRCLPVGRLPRGMRHSRPSGRTGLEALVTYRGPGEPGFEPFRTWLNADRPKSSRSVSQTQAQIREGSPKRSRFGQH